MSPRDEMPSMRLPFPFGLILLYAFTAVSIFGYWAFALHPQWIPDVGRAFFGVSFQLFVQLHVVLAALVLGAYLTRHLRFRWILPFLMVCLISFLVEYSGTRYGVPFGDYRYTELLGPKLMNLVPVLIPVSWFLMALPSFGLAAQASPGVSGRPLRFSLAVTLLVAWDLALDPAMSFLTPYWVWEGGGGYYGMPWINLVGWTITAGVIMGALELLGTERWIQVLSARWLGGYYSGVFLLPVGLAAAGGLWPAVGISVLCAGGLLYICYRLRTKRFASPSNAPRSHAQPTQVQPDGGLT